MNIAIFHKTLSVLGGAEKFVGLIASQLKKKGHNVFILTFDYNKNLTFPELENIPKYIIPPIHFLPKQFFDLEEFINGFRIFIKNFRITKPDFVFFSSNYSLGVFYKLFMRSKIGSYVHFPDKIIFKPKRLIKKILYRWFIDFLEGKSYAISDLLYTNSKFTQKTIYNTFHVAPKVIYPFPLDLTLFDYPLDNIKEPYFISVNRICAQKLIHIAIHSFAKIAQEFPKYNLIIAGFLQEQNYFDSLVLLTKKYNIENRVFFKTNLSDNEIYRLLSHATLALYTAIDEHCGGVPFIASLLHTPTIACNSGGPMETIIHEQTGLTLPPNPTIWAKEFSRLLNNPELITKMGEKGRQRILNEFTWEKQQMKIINAIDHLK